ncbi:uncharacterized protein LOC130504873 [Raphanus sativus]|uniref:Uncharacterized protein LOC130504873 n=1 Tax=Raphanus sativus TaxID=3726 RepID=A0A9W3CV33_RAPSA|nr:uncharacterized protein LOC130504873 [Raphanus sativus]
MATTATASSDSGEGPVMALINKRLRALRKKLNRITQMEESLSQGKTLNKEQQEVLRSKPSVLVLIDELDKLRSPLSSAVSEEISLATATAAPHNAPPPPDQTTTTEEEEAPAVAPKEEKLEDLVNLLYFGSLFDVRSASELASVMMTRRHERGCCLVYDTVTDESTEDLLCDKDLDLISKLWGMMVSRPADSGLSHEKALERCVEHAKLWLANSDQKIASNCDVSYAALREKVKKIMGSNYFTITPEMVVAPVEAAAEAGHFGSFQVAADNEQKEDVSNFKVQESVGNDQYEQQKDESVVTEGEVVQGQQEQGYTQVEGGRSKRDYQQQQQYVPRGSHQNQRGHRGARRGHSNAPRGGRGGGGYSNGRFESYDNAGGNGYQRSYYNNRGRGRGGGGGGGNGHSYNNNNNHQDSNVSVAS